MAGNPLTDPDWAVNTTDQVVRLVESVKSKTTKPAVLVARGLVFGLMAIFIERTWSQVGMTPPSGRVQLRH